MIEYVYASSLHNFQSVCKKNILIGFMYGISTYSSFTYVYHTDQLNVDKYTIYGFYGIRTFQSSNVSEGRKRIKSHLTVLTSLRKPQTWRSFLLEQSLGK